MAVVDLSKWDFAVEFMLYEAAALIVGIDPAEIYTETKPAEDNPRIYDYHEHPQIKPAVDRMKYDFFMACDLYTAMQVGKWKLSSTEPLSELLLRNREMEVVPVKIGSWCLPLDSVTQRALDTWYGSDDIAMYETAKFTRSEMSRWLSVNNLHSVYRFDLSPKVEVQALADKPLSPREHATYLNIIGALVELIQSHKPGRDSDAAVIREMLENYSDKSGIKERTLQEKFAAAKRCLHAD